MNEFTKEMLDEIEAQALDTKAKLDAGTHHIVDGELVEK